MKDAECHEPYMKCLCLHQAMPNYTTSNSTLLFHPTFVDHIIPYHMPHFAISCSVTPNHTIFYYTIPHLVLLYFSYLLYNKNKYNLFHSSESYLSTGVKNAVITVPAYFNDSQRQVSNVSSNKVNPMTLSKSSVPRTQKSDALPLHFT